MRKGIDSFYTNLAKELSLSVDCYRDLNYDTKMLVNKVFKLYEENEELNNNMDRLELVSSDLRKQLKRTRYVLDAREYEDEIDLDELRDEFETYIEDID